MDAKIFLFQFRDNVLQGIAILSGDPNHIRLNRRLHFRFRVLDEPYDFFALSCGIPC